MKTKTLHLPTPAKAVHYCQIPQWPSDRGEAITIALAGCGGNGAQMLSKLARLDYALRQTTRRAGLHVTVFDPDHVSRSNVGRQLFSPSDVGLSKAVVLVARINAFFGLDWTAVPDIYEGLVPAMAWGNGAMSAPDILISCVDTAFSRRQFHDGHVKPYGPRPALAPRYWLDLGNKKSSGQVILGEPTGLNGLMRDRHTPMMTGVVSSNDLAKDGKSALDVFLEGPHAARLPVVTEVFPELLDPKFDEGDEPSCSVAQALEKQSLFVNDAMSDCAAHLLDQLLRIGKIDYHGAYINLETGRTNPIPIPVQAHKEEAKAA